MSGPEQLGQAPGLVIVRQAEGAVVLDYDGGPYVRLTPAKWEQLLHAMAGIRPQRRRSGTGWPPSA